LITKGREKILEGINKTVNVVKSTYGAKGRTVLIQNNFLHDQFTVTKDGVSVARSVRLEDDIENFGAVFVQHAAKKTVDEAGDGTTCSSILVQKMCQVAEEELKAGVTIHKLQEDLDTDLKVVKEYLVQNSQKIENVNQIKQIATISANNDEKIGQLFADVYEEIGFNGSVAVVETENAETTFESVKGFTLPNSGYAGTVFINNRDKGTVEYLNPKILIYNNLVTNLVDSKFGNLIEENIVSNPDIRPLVIICRDIDEVPLKQLIDALRLNQVKDICIVTSNLVMDREDRFRDASAFLDAEYSEDSILKLGECKKIIIEKDRVNFYNGNGDISDYLKKLKKQKNQNANLKDRIFNLESNAAIISVGGKLQTEIQEEKDRIDDAACAVKSAIEEGFCPGAGTTYLFATDYLPFKSRIMFTSLTECIEQLFKNAEVVKGTLFSTILLKGFGYGYDVKDLEIVNLKEKGIIDSTKVLRVALENAVHTVKTYITIDSIITSNK